MRRLGSAPLLALGCAFVIALCCVTVKSAGATMSSIPSAAISIGFNYIPTITTPGSVTETNSAGASTASAYWSSGVGYASVSGAGVGGEFASGLSINTGASAISYLEVSGPTTHGSIPLIFTAAGSASASGTASSYAKVLIAPNGTALWDFLFTATAQTGVGASPQTPSSTFSGSQTAYVTPNTVYYVNTEAYISIGFYPGSASATADPMVVIDPTFAYAGEYNLTLSPDLTPGPPAAAPAPCTVLLLGPGLIGLGALRRRLKK